MRFVKHYRLLAFTLEYHAGAGCLALIARNNAYNEKLNYLICK